LPKAAIKQSLIPIVAWIIVVALCIPYAMNLDKVLSYKEEAFLPENVESIIAKNIVEEKFKDEEKIKGVDLAIIVKGVDPRSKDVEEKYRIFKDKVSNVVEEANTVYDVLWDAQEEYDEFIQNITKELREELRDNLKENISDMHEALYSLKNVTMDFEKAFLNLTDELRELHDRIYDVEEAIISFDREYSEAFERAIELHKLLYGIRNFTILVNETYGQVFRNVTELHYLVHQIAYMLRSYNSLYFDMSLLYAYTFWDTTRAHYYLTYTTDAYVNPPIDNTDLKTLTYYTNVSVVMPELGPVNTTLASMTYYFIFNKYPFAPLSAKDADFVKLTSEVVENSIGSQVPLEFYNQSILWVNCFSISYNATLYSWKNKYNVSELWMKYAYIPSEQPPITSYYSQVQMLNNILSLSNSSIENAVFMYVQVTAPILSSETGIPQDVAEEILYKAYEIGRSPTSDKVERALAQIFNKLITDAPFNVSQVVSYLYEIGPTPQYEALGSISRKITFDLFKPYVAQYGISETLLNSTVSMVSLKYPLNMDEAKELTISIVTKMLKGLKIPQNMLEKIYDLDVQPEILDFKKMFLKMFRVPGNETINVIISTVVLRGPHLVRHADVFRDTVISCIMRILSIENITIEDFSWNEMRDLVSKLYNLGPSPKNESIENIAKDIIYDRLEKIAKEHDVDVEDLRKVADMVFNYGSPLTEKEYRQIVVDMSYDEFIETIEENEELNKTFSKIDIREFIEDIYDLGVQPSREDVENLAYKYADIITDSLVQGIIEEHPRPETIDDLPEEVVEIYVPKNDVLLILTSPIGENSVEKYRHSLDVYEKAKEVFGASGGILGFIPHKNKVEVFILGPALSSGELEIYGSRDIEIIDKVSSVFTLIVMIIVLSSVIAFFIPLINVGIALIVAFASMYFIATKVMDVIYWARIFTIVTTLGATVDYTTYYLLRFKNELKTCSRVDLALENTMKKVTVPILISGLTTAAGFACLSFAWDFPFVRVLGITIPIGVLAALAVSLTLTPALLRITRGKIWIPRIKLSKKMRQSKIAAKVAKHGPIVLIIVLALALPIGMIALSFKGSHDYSVLLPEYSVTVQNIRGLREVIDQGIFAPTTIVLEFKDNVWNNESLSIIEDICWKIEAINGVSKVYSPTRPRGVPLSKPYNMSELEEKGALDFVADDNKTVIVKVILKYFPTSDEASHVVENIKRVVKSYESPLVSRILVGGITARIIDLDHVLTVAFKEKILVAAIISMFIILAILLRSTPLALASIGITVFNIGVAMSVTIILFSYILKKPLIWFTHIVVFSAMLGINIDYISYFINKVKEDIGRVNVEEAIVEAASSIGGSIIGLALIVVAAYGSLLLGSSWAMKEFGFVLATGVLFTGLTIPYITGPAILSTLGLKAWWPFKIKREEIS